jgi:hypothetical protein
MSNEDDEFKDVEKGLPSENTAQKSSIKFLLIFLVSAVIIILIVLQLGNTIGEFIEGFSEFGKIPGQIVLNGSISLLLGIIQALIFRSKIKSRLYVFIAVSLLGGVVGGFVGGLLLNSGLYVQPIIGAVNGLLAGGISSLAQNRLMSNKKYGWRWFLYNSISWALIFAIAWAIGSDPNNLPLVALAGGFLIVACGISLVLFLRKTPQIEFS